MKWPSNESIVAAVCIIMVGVLAWVILSYPGSAALGTVAGIIGGVVGGILLAIGLYVGQSPSFTVRVAEDKFNEKLGGMYFLHVIVKNRARGFLGGGTAADCQGVLKTSGSTFTPKWASRPEPLSWHLIPIEGNQLQAVPWIDWALMAECARETLGPQEEKSLDIAVKVRGDSQVYIHEPGNYEHPQHKKNPLGPGVHELLLTLKYRGGESPPFKIRLHNDDKPEADSVRLTMG